MKDYVICIEEPEGLIFLQPNGSWTSSVETAELFYKEAAEYRARMYIGGQALRI